MQYHLGNDYYNVNPREITMKKIACLAVLFALAFGVAASCAEELTPPSEFGFNLYRTLVKTQPDKNLTVSPYGVEQLLDLARHETTTSRSKMVQK
jgi:hypothetical protein